jgi:uncharacterized membrane protein
MSISLQTQQDAQYVNEFALVAAVYQVMGGVELTLNPRLFFAHAALNIASDVAIVILLIPAIRSPTLPRGLNISAIAILVLGRL